MFDVKAKSLVVLNACAVCEHRHPAGCNHCDLDVTAPNDPWWPEAAVQDKINVASGEDALVHS
jgi:hypothetical protein